MGKTNKVKMGPLGTPLGNPLGFFNSQKAKRSVEPKQTLRKAQFGIPPTDPPTSNFTGKMIGPQNEGVVDKGYWFNNLEKRAMADAKSRYGASRTRDNNNDPNAEKEYGDLIKNYQPKGPIVPLENQVAELNKKYPYSEGFEEVPYKGGYNNKGWVEDYRKANKEPYYKEKALSDPYPNVGTGLIKRKGGVIMKKGGTIKKIVKKK